MGTYLLDFPNNEVRKGFLSVLAANYMKPKSKEVTSWITDAVMDLERGDTDAFRRSLTSFLASIPYDSHGSLKDIDITEKHFQYTFYLLLRLIGVYCTAIHCEAEGEYIVKQRILIELFDSPCIENYNNVFVDNDVVYFNLNNGIASYSKNTDSLSPTLESALSLSSVTASSSDKKEKRLPLSGNVELESNYRDLLFSVSLPHYNKLSVHFHYVLQGGQGMALTSDLKEPEIRYGSLDYGEYTFQAEAYNDLGQKIGEVEYHFAIARPFYLSYYAFALYLIVLTALVYFFSKWRANRAMEKKRKEYEAEQVQQNIKMREQEHLITLQQQQLLEAELSAKSKDLASMALGVFAKNEVLEKLRTVVQESLVKGQYGRKNLESLLKLINENIETQEFWDVFQNNFDLIHEKFFRNLRERYPSLTATDLRFCALLRLNLSTKDIAQMTNLTIRGVEAARYRLRKKLDIPDGTGLVDFLIDLK